MEENIETYMARFLVTSTATTYHGTREATTRALFYDTHAMLDGSTQDNLATGADLTYSTFWTALVAAENQTDHRGFKTQRKVKNLWFPPQLEKNANEVLLSPDRPDTGNRAINAYAKSGRNIGRKKWAHLTDTDAWYFQLDGRAIKFFWRRKTRFARERDFSTGDMMCKADQRFSAEIDDAMGWYGNVP